MQQDSDQGLESYSETPHNKTNMWYNSSPTLNNYNLFYGYPESQPNQIKNCWDSGYLPSTLTSLPWPAGHEFIPATPIDECREVSKYPWQVQDFLANWRSTEPTEAIDAFKPYFCELVKEEHGNYVLQGLLIRCQSQERFQLISQFAGSLAALAKHSLASLFLQTALTLCKTQAEDDFYAAEVRGKVVDLAFDDYGCFVIQKFLSVTKNRHCIIRELLGHTHTLAVTKAGVHVIKEALTDPAIFAELTEHLVSLMQDTFGSWAVLHMIDIWAEECSFPMCCAVKGKVVQLCLLRHASRVLVKCLDDETMQHAIVEELVASNQWKQLLGSPYGCAIVCSIVGTVEDSLKAQLTPSIKAAFTHVPPNNLRSQWDDITLKIYN